MPILNPDTSDAEDFSKPISPGTYKAKIVACDGGKSKAGNQKAVPKLKITTDDGVRTRSAHLVVSGEGSMGFDQLLRACDMGDLADAYRDKNVSPKPPFDTDSVVGHEVLVIVEENLYHNPETKQDEKRDQISGFLRA